MAATHPVTVFPPADGKARHARVDGEILGRAYSVRDIARFLQEAGLQSWDEMDVVRSRLVDWRGGGPGEWTAGGTSGA